PSYKQEETLRYNGRDVAVVRGKLLACPVILGSATPALETYENCRQGRYRLLEITRRVEQRPLPVIETIDLRARFERQFLFRASNFNFPQPSRVRQFRSMPYLRLCLALSSLQRHPRVASEAKQNVVSPL